MQKAILKLVFKRVPRLGKGWRYVPLHQLPEGTLLRIECEGLGFTLKTGIYPCCTIHDFKGLPDGFPVKPTLQCLAPTSVFRANYDLNYETHEFVSPKITSIEVIGTHYVLKKEDGQIGF